MKMSVVIPAYNEAESLPETLPILYSELTKEKIDHEILVLMIIQMMQLRKYLKI